MDINLLFGDTALVLFAENGGLTIENGDPALFLSGAASDDASIFNFNLIDNAIWLAATGI